MEIKESNEICIVIQDAHEREALLNILAHHQYEVTVKTVSDGMGLRPKWYIVSAHKVV